MVKGGNITLKRGGQRIYPLGLPPRQKKAGSLRKKMFFFYREYVFRDTDKSEPSHGEEGQQPF